MQMHMVVCICVIQGKASLPESLKLRANLHFQLLSNSGHKKEIKARLYQMGGKLPVNIHQIWNLPRLGNRTAFYKGEMKSDF